MDIIDGFYQVVRLIHNDDISRQFDPTCRPCRLVEEQVVRQRHHLVTSRTTLQLLLAIDIQGILHWKDKSWAEYDLNMNMIKYEI